MNDEIEPALMAKAQAIADKIEYCRRWGTVSECQRTAGYCECISIARSRSDSAIPGVG